MGDFVNEFNEKISAEKVSELTERIINLSDDNIDELWFRCEFIMADHKKDELKALRKDDIENIRSGVDDAEDTVVALLTETPIKDVEKNLEELE